MRRLAKATKPTNPTNPTSVQLLINPSHVNQSVQFFFFSFFFLSFFPFCFHLLSSFRSSSFFFPPPPSTKTTFALSCLSVCSRLIPLHLLHRKRTARNAT
ncbi:hypothetical protein K504DRAFT_32926 [Pleomassaria siparia CBS 279.74]|uniref:Transmembrane protein n=1 Tax=Pleomassaria siparia CBS 279.74 TaxID=1314801 RepID=A0A6G1KTQ7_9PLEO|nr:hypothetical protein K504DRAFT_32926 [Pleomassaria siparia CBS 279.74]